MLLYLVVQIFDNLLGTVKVILLEYLKQVFVTKLLLLAIFSLVQSVAIDQQRLSFNILYVFSNKFRESQGQVFDPSDNILGNRSFLV